LNLGERRAVIGIVFHQFGQLNGFGDFGAERLPGLDLAFQLLELAQMRLGLLRRVPEVGTAGDLFEPLDFQGVVVEVKDTAGRERLALRRLSVVQSIPAWVFHSRFCLRTDRFWGRSSVLAREKRKRKTIHPQISQVFGLMLLRAWLKMLAGVWNEGVKNVLLWTAARLLPLCLHPVTGIGGK
jgi:hypothetical protein